VEEQFSEHPTHPPFRPISGPPFAQSPRLINSIITVTIPSSLLISFIPSYISSSFALFLFLVTHFLPLDPNSWPARPQSPPLAQGASILWKVKPCLLNDQSHKELLCKCIFIRPHTHSIVVGTDRPPVPMISCGSLAPSLNSSHFTQFRWVYSCHLVSLATTPYNINCFFTGSYETRVQSCLAKAFSFPR
jgi:hypothetical protein